MIEFLNRLLETIEKHRKTFLALGTALALSAAPFAVLLYANLRSSIEELLPRSAPSIAALDELNRRLGESLQLGLYLSGPPAEKLHAYADALAERLQKAPGGPRYIDYRPHELQDFFLPRRALFLDKADLEELDRRIDAQIAHARRAANPFDVGLDDEEPPPLEGVFDHYQDRAAALRVFPSGYYDGEDGHSLAMVLYPAQSVKGYEASRDFRNLVARTAEGLAAEMGLHDLSIEYAGDVMAVIQEQRSLQADLVVSSIVVLVLEAVLLLAFFRWRPSLPALGFPLAVGTIVTLGISYLALGSLNASTAFLGSIIVGNGINPGIMLLARFMEERRSGSAPTDAMRTAVRATALPTLVASAAAGLSYGALMITDFRGYSQFGLMGLLGMSLCWVSTYLWLPPMALALDGRWPVSPAQRSRAGEGSLVDRALAVIGRFAVGRARTVVAATIAVSALAFVAVARVAPDPYEHDTTKLRSRWATEPGGYIEVSHKMDRILQRATTPVVVLTGSQEDVEPIAERYRQVLKEGGADMVLGSVMTIQALVPPHQAEKIAIIDRIRQKLGPSVLKSLPADTRKLVDEWMPPPDLRPFGIHDVPESVRRQFREKDGSIGRFVLLFTKKNARTTDGRIVQKFAEEVRSVPVPPTAKIAGSYLIFADMFTAIGHDGPIATVLSLLGVVLLSLALARGARGGLQVTLSLLAGVLWMMGLTAVSGMRLNFLNFIALPITFGIGVDYATNVYGRYRLSPPTRDSIVRAVSHSGAAVAACSATTVIGYSSLLFSRNNALFSFGMLAVVGELACLAAALVLLPAMLGLGVEQAAHVAPLAPAAQPDGER